MKNSSPKVQVNYVLLHRMSVCSPEKPFTMHVEVKILTVRQRLIIIITDIENWGALVGTETIACIV